MGPGGTHELQGMWAPAAAVAGYRGPDLPGPLPSGGQAAACVHSCDPTSRPSSPAQWTTGSSSQRGLPQVEGGWVDR